jgi:hypothetical protein
MLQLPLATVSIDAQAWILWQKALPSGHLQLPFEQIWPNSVQLFRQRPQLSGSFCKSLVTTWAEHTPALQVPAV